MAKSESDQDLMVFFERAGTGQYAVLPVVGRPEVLEEAEQAGQELEIEIEEAVQPGQELEIEPTFSEPSDLLLPSPIQLLECILAIAGEGKPDNYYQVRLNVGKNDSGEELREVYRVSDWTEVESGNQISGPEALLDQIVENVRFAQEMRVRELPISIVLYHPKKNDLADIEGLIGHAFSISLMPEDVLQPEGYVPSSIKFDFNLRSYNSGPYVKKALQATASWEVASKVFAEVLSSCGRPMPEEELPFATVIEEIDVLANAVPAKTAGVKFNEEVYRAYVTLLLEPRRTMFEMEDRYSGSGMFAQMRHFADKHQSKTGMQFGASTIVARFSQEYKPGELGTWPKE